MKEVKAYVRQGMASHVVDALVTEPGLHFSVVEVKGISPGLPPGSYDYSVGLGPVGHLPAGEQPLDHRRRDRRRPPPVLPGELLRGHLQVDDPHPRPVGREQPDARAPDLPAQMSRRTVHRERPPKLRHLLPLPLPQRPRTPRPRQPRLPQPRPLTAIPMLG